MSKMGPSIPQKPSGLHELSAWKLSFIILWLSLFLGYLPDFASVEYLKLGCFVPLLAATVLTIGFGIVLGIVLFLTRRSSYRWRRGFVLLMTATSVV